MSVDRVLIVGHGSIGRRHLRVGKRLLPEADIRVLRSNPGSSLSEGTHGHFTNLMDALAFRPQMAVIANPAPFHLAVGNPLLDAGVHLLVEKPISSSPDGVADFVRNARSRRLVLLVGYNLRYLPSLQKFRELVLSEFIGRVLSVRCEVGQYLPSWRPGEDYRQSVSARKKLGGGVLLELSHEIDYLRWIFGEVDWVLASLGHRSSLDIDVEDSANLIVGIRHGRQGSQLTAAIQMDCFRYDTTRTCTAVGEIGSLRWNGITGEIEHFGAGGRVWEKIFEAQGDRDETYEAEWNEILRAIQRGGEVSVTGEDGAAVINVISAAITSNSTGQRVVV